MLRNVYCGRLKLNGEEHQSTLRAALNYASTLSELQRFEETKLLMRTNLPVARRVSGESHELTLSMRANYARALYTDPAATLDDLREAVTTVEDLERTTRRVLGGAHPFMARIEQYLRNARAKLRAREAPPASETAAATAVPDSAVPASPSLADVASQFKEAVSVGNDTPSPRSA